jgi:4-hydroxy-tetrahydrodipicolinate synthase
METLSRSPLTGLTGYITAVPTPFRDNSLDECALRAFVDWQIEQGISGLVVAGTTGEAPALSDTEQRRVVATAVDAVRGRVPVIAGVGAPDTRHALTLAQQAQDAGADGLLGVTPYYTRPSQEGLWRHFEVIHNATSIPILLYDVPMRTGCTLSVDLIVRLAALPRIVGLKDATGDLTRPLRLRKLLGRGFRLFSGDDLTSLDFQAMGGDGCISVLSNVVPCQCAWLDSEWRRGNAAEATTMARNLGPLTSALFAESNPIPVKFALDMLSHMAAEVRLPLCAPSFGTRVRVTQALDHLHLLTSAKGRRNQTGRAPAL